jgi:tetratricopeptide (TPR) repeat protein/tRNA A-37 threonylcarbamoyl transferase component Bud32
LLLSARIDQVCDRFEAAWAKGVRPSIEKHLGDETEPGRSALFRELLQSEWECRRQLGERPTAAEYRLRFPGLAALVDELFGPHGPGSEQVPETGSTVNYSSANPAPVHGRYVNQKYHAGGGIGEIYRAEDCQIGREVALKRLRDRAAPRQRFLAEAQVTGQLEHPGIVPVHDLGMDEEGRPFYVMKFVRGRTLKEVIAAYHAGERSSAAEREVQRHRLLETFIAICQAVAYAHSRGVVHRDLKPDNVMVGPFGETIVIDWGLAKLVGHPYVRGGNELVYLTSSSGSAPTIAGVYMGSPPYMAPELADGRADDADERTDVYLLGATLYEILTGRAPRRGSSRDELLELARSVDPVPPRQVKAEIPRPLEAICLKAMTRRKEDRYPGAGTLAEDVQRYLAGEPVSVYREGLPARSWRWCKRHRRAVERTAAAVLVLAVTMGAGLALRRAGLAEREAAQVRQREQARVDVAEFRRLSDEAHFFAASTLPDDRRAPYYDVRESESKAEGALAKAGSWADDLSMLPLADERDALRNELYDLLLLLAQNRIQQGPPARGTAEKALPWLERARALHPATRSYHRLRSTCAELLGDRKTAEAEQQRSQDPRTPAIAIDHFLTGESLRTQSAAPDDSPGAMPDRSRLEQALEAYRQALELDPDHYWSRFQMSRCYLALNRRPEAIEVLSACVALRPDSPWGYSARGLALAFQKRFEDALRDLNRAIALGSRPAQLNRGMVYRLQKQYDPALADFEAVLQPPNGRRLIEAAYYRGQVEWDRDRFPEAEHELDRVVAVNPDFRPVYAARARVRFVLGNQSGGRDDLNRYLSLTRGADLGLESAEAYRLRGYFLRLLLVKKVPGPRRKAIALWALAELQKAIKLGDRSPRLYQDLGVVHEKLGQSQPAIDAYTQALVLAPGEVQTRVMRGWVYVERKQFARAEADFTAAIGLDPDHAEAHAGLGFVRATLNAPGDAQREALQAMLSMDKVHHASDYIALHDVACICAVLAKSNAGHATEYQDQTIDLLRRALEMWRNRGDGPSEIDYIEGESAFDQALRARPEFQALIKPEE